MWFSFSVIVFDSVVEIHVVAPAGVITSSVKSGTNQFREMVYRRNITFTPTSSQTGQHIICFTAVDDKGYDKPFDHSMYYYYCTLVEI